MATIKQFIKDTHQKLKSFRRSHEEEEIKPLAHHTEEKERPAQKFELTVSAATIAKWAAITILLLLLTAFLYEIRDILVIFLVALLFSAALDPMVDGLERRRVPRSIGVILVYIAILFVLGFVLSNLIPVVAKEVSELAVRVQEFISNIVNGEITLPGFLERYRPLIKEFFEGVDISKVSGYKDILIQVANRISDVAGNVINLILVTFNGFFNAILVLVLTFLMTIDEAGIDKFILSLFPARHADYIRAKSNAIKEKMGYWLRGQVVLCFIVGILVYLGFLVIGLFTQNVEYSATIALVAGLTELIPYAGPFIAWIIALPIVANQSLVLILWMTGLMYIVQVMENNFIVPMVMKKAVGMSPIFIMFAMFVGFQFLGVLGVVLSVPLATAIALFVKDYAEKEK